MAKEQRLAEDGLQAQVAALRHASQEREDALLAHGNTMAELQRELDDARALNKDLQSRYELSTHASADVGSSKDRANLLQFHNEQGATAGKLIDEQSRYSLSG